MEHVPTKHCLDCRGLKCPLPILHTRLQLNKLRKGDTLEILTDDEGFIRDFSIFAFQSSIKTLEVVDFPAYKKILVEVLK